MPSTSNQDPPGASPAQQQFPYATEPASDPPMIRYTDASGTLREIFLPLGTYSRALSLLEAEDWDALSQFPRWSDQPAIESVQPDMMSYTDPRNGIERYIFLPLGQVEHASQLLMDEDWAALEAEFEPHTGQIREDAEMFAEHERGVQRCRREREEKEKEKEKEASIQAQQSSK